MPKLVIGAFDPRADPELPRPERREQLHRLILGPPPAHPRPVHVHLLWFSQQMVELVSGESTFWSVAAVRASSPRPRAGIRLNGSSAAILQA